MFLLQFPDFHIGFCQYTIVLLGFFYVFFPLHKKRYIHCTTKITNAEQRNKIHHITNLDSRQLKRNKNKNDAKDFPKSLLLHNLFIKSETYNTTLYNMSLIESRPMPVFLLSQRLYRFFLCCWVTILLTLIKLIIFFRKVEQTILNRMNDVRMTLSNISKNIVSSSPGNLFNTLCFKKSVILNTFL